MRSDYILSVSLLYVAGTLLNLLNHLHRSGKLFFLLFYFQDSIKRAFGLILSNLQRKEETRNSKATCRFAYTNVNLRRVT